MRGRKINLFRSALPNVEHIDTLLAQAVYQGCFNRLRREANVVTDHNGTGVDHLGVSAANASRNILVEFVGDAASHIIGFKAADRLRHGWVP